MKKKTKLKLGVLFAMVASIIISSLLSILFSMHYMSHLYSIASMNAKTAMTINKRIDLIEQKAKPSGKKYVKPVSL